MCSTLKRLAAVSYKSPVLREEENRFIRGSWDNWVTRRKDSKRGDARWSENRPDNGSYDFFISKIPS